LNSAAFQGAACNSGGRIAGDASSESHLAATQLFSRSTNAGSSLALPPGHTIPYHTPAVAVPPPRPRHQRPSPRPRAPRQSNATALPPSMTASLLQTQGCSEPDYVAPESLLHVSSLESVLQGHGAHRGGRRREVKAVAPRALAKKRANVRRQLFLLVRAVDLVVFADLLVQAC